SLFFASSTSAQQPEKRIALVIGNAAYQAEALPTAANDAGLIAQTLQAAGFDVLGARDLDQDTLRQTFRDFLEKATASGPDTVAFVYLNGYGVQLEGENYFVPVDAKITRDTDVPIEAIRISDYIRPLASLNLKAGVVVLDVARAHPFAKAGQPLASGLALVEPEKGMLVAFNAAPGTVAPPEQGPYGAYAQALAEMMRTGGLPLGEVFDRVRLRVNEMTKGGEVPWNTSKVETPFFFLERAPDAPPPAVSSDQISSIRSKPIRDLDAQDAYISALERDTLDGYLEFLATYPHDPMARRVRAIVAARREALTWRHTRVIDTPQAYWSYLRRYPRGPHIGDARRRLAYLAAEFEPPPSFAEIPYDLPPPPEEEVIYFRRPVLVFDDPDYGFIPPPPPPIFFLPPPPPDFVDLSPPPPAFELFVLPVPVFVPVPEYYNPPVYVAAPPPNVIYNNIHNTVVINNTTNTVTITNPQGQTQTVTPAQALAPQPAAAGSTPGAAPAAPAPLPGAAPTAPAPSPGSSSGSRTPLAPGAKAAGGAAAGAALLAPSLPPSVAQKAIKIQSQSPTTAPGPQRTPSAQQPGQPAAGQTTTPSGRPTPSAKAAAPPPGQSSTPQGQPLPGQRGQPLPPVQGAAPATAQPAPQPGKPPQSGQTTTPSGQPTPSAKAAAPPPGQSSTPQGQPLPGQHGQPLPPVQGAAPATAQPAPQPGAAHPSPPAPAAAAHPAPPPPPPPVAHPVAPSPPPAAHPSPSPPAPAAAAHPAPPPPPPPAARPAAPACPPGLRMVGGNCVK
ncbi:MAG TPA: caspase domain-containing protein, partial [Steroidobacteraceae bacterium]|nr:caspase domain-containing protein [Steroidobacteraceae bacterium]